MPQDTARAIREKEREIYKAQLEDQKFQEQKKLEEAEKEAIKQGKEAKKLEEEAKKSEEYKMLENLLFLPNIKLDNIGDEEKTVLYKIIIWIDKIERSFKERFQELEHKLKELENQIEYL